MNPFSPLMYIKRNRARAISIIIMLACTAIVFMGGMYIDNIEDVYAYAYEDPGVYALWFGNGNNNDINEEVRELFRDQEGLFPESAKNYIGVDIRYANYKSIMGFNNGITVFFPTNKEDFKTMVELTGLLPKELDIADGELVISEMLANNWGVKEGDVLGNDDKNPKIGLPRPMTIKKILPLKGMQIYGWSEEFNINGSMILPTSEQHASTLSDDLNRLREVIIGKYPHIMMYTNEYQIEQCREQTSMFKYFFIVILIVVAIVFAITLNATFAAMYDKRKYEFSIYKAIGFSKGKMFSKVLGEMMAMDAIGLLAGAAICFVVIKVFNELSWEEGQQFIKVSLMGILGTVVCNIAVILPVVLSNMKRIKRYDVTVY